MNSFIPLHCHSTYSLLDGLSQPDQIIKRLDKIECNSMALTDHGTVSGCVSFYETMKKSGRKPILGLEAYISKKDSNIKKSENIKSDHQVILAKNLKGWQDLLSLITESNHIDNFYYKPRLDMGKIANHCHGNFISFSGHLGSTLANAMTENDNLLPDWEKIGIKKAHELANIFGRDNFYLEVQLIDSETNKPAKIMGECIRVISQKTGIPCVATPDAHYPDRSDAKDQRILLCAMMKCTLVDLENNPKMCFAKSDNYFIPSYKDIKRFHTEEELENTIKITEGCEEYDILSKPKLPEYICPNNINPDKYIRQLCANGWRKLMGYVEKDSEDFKLYGKRISNELKVIENAHLSSYFLIVKDIVDWVESSGSLTGPGRGSSAGSMVSYLLNITKINPVEHNLIFERFYNAGRNTGDDISLPDIDLDFAKYDRSRVINYIVDKYGKDKVAPIITFQSIKGRGALKRVFAAYGDMDFEEQNSITREMEDESKIADDLEEMGDEASIIRWNLENKPNKFKEYVKIGKRGKLEGPLADKFEQAIRLEGTKISQSKHPAGIIISKEIIEKTCPLVLDRDRKQLCAGFEGKDCEKLGLVKLDILGIATLDKIMKIVNLIKG